jgi:hypothetical protein
MSDQVDRQVEEKPTQPVPRRHGKLRLRRRPPQPRGPQRTPPPPEDRSAERQSTRRDSLPGDKSILDDVDRSDRDSGRPLQLEEGESGGTASRP